MYACMPWMMVGIVMMIYLYCVVLRSVVRMVYSMKFINHDLLLWWWWCLRITTWWRQKLACPHATPLHSAQNRSLFRDGNTYVLKMGHEKQEQPSSPTLLLKRKSNAEDSVITKGGAGLMDSGSRHGSPVGTVPGILLDWLVGRVKSYWGEAIHIRLSSLQWGSSRQP